MPHLQKQNIEEKVKKKIITSGLGAKKLGLRMIKNVDKKCLIVWPVLLQQQQQQFLD